MLNQLTEVMKMNRSDERLNPVIYPTMVIGLGGMGVSVVRHVKQRFRLMWNKWSNGRVEQEELTEKLPGLLQLLAVDTEELVNQPGKEPLYSHEFAYLGKFDATRLVDHKQHHPEIDAWWHYPDLPLGYIFHGAHQLRPIGRLAFFRNYVTFRQMLEDKYDDLRKFRDIEHAQNCGFPVVDNLQLIYIVCSLCGGTGAGMFLDVVHRVRALVRNNARIVGIFFLPSTLEQDVRSDLQRRRIKANTYAALKELNYFQETQRFKALYPSEERSLPDTPYRPLDNIFLLERMNVDGRSLSSKAEAEQLAAHLIQLHSFSHLSSEILKVEVNVTSERTAHVSNPRPSTTADTQKYLSYSSFSASAIVMPQETLLEFWRHVFAGDVLDRFVRSVRNPAVDTWDSVWNRHLTLRNQLRTQFQQVADKPATPTELTTAIHKVNMTIKEVNQRRGYWHTTWHAIAEEFRQTIAETGLEGALMLSKCVAPSEGKGHRESLTNSHLFQIDDPPRRVEETDREAWKEQASSHAGIWEQISGLIARASGKSTRKSEEIRERRRMQAELSLRLDELDRAIIDAVKEKIHELREALDRQRRVIEEESLPEADRNARKAADHLQPHVLDHSASTETVYELETGAVGHDYLDLFLEETRRELGEEVWVDTLQELTHDFWTGLPEVMSASKMLEGIDRIIGSRPDVLERVRDLADIQHVLKVQYADGVPRPYNRRDQLFQRTGPFLRWDGDRFQFNEADLEHIRVVGVPDDGDKSLLTTLASYRDFTRVRTGDRTRMDTVWIVHGFRVDLIEKLEEFYAQYDSKDFNKRELHLNPKWLGPVDPGRNGDPDNIELPEILPPGSEPSSTSSAEPKKTSEDTSFKWTGRI